MKNYRLPLILLVILALVFFVFGCSRHKSDRSESKTAEETPGFHVAPGPTERWNAAPVNFQAAAPTAFDYYVIASDSFRCEPVNLMVLYTGSSDAAAMAYELVNAAPFAGAGDFICVVMTDPPAGGQFLVDVVDEVRKDFDIIGDYAYLVFESEPDVFAGSQPYAAFRVAEITSSTLYHLGVTGFDSCVFEYPSGPAVEQAGIINSYYAFPSESVPCFSPNGFSPFEPIKFTNAIELFERD